jgi:transposase
MGHSKRYDKQFKIEASKLVVEHGYSYKQAGERLGVTGWSVRHWVKHLRQTGDLPPDAETRPAAEEMRRIREENKRLRMENEILKKAAAYFAKDSLQ